MDLERLLPKVDAEDLDEDRRIAFAEAALSKIAALEAAADGDATVLAQVATYEEAMLVSSTGCDRPRRRSRQRQAPGGRGGAAPCPPRKASPRAIPRRSRPRTRPIPCKGAGDDDRAPESVVARRPREVARAVEKNGKLDDATSQNQNAVSKERTASTCARRGEDADAAPGSRRWWPLLRRFLGTYVFIAVFPKHR